MKDLQTLIKSSRSSVIPSEWYDNLPLIVCQAYAMGKPVIASAINGIPEYVENGIDGLLFEAGNAEQLARCIQRLNDDTGLLCAMAKNARRKAEDVFDYRAYWRTLRPVLEHLRSPHITNEAGPSGVSATATSLVSTDKRRFTY